MIIEKVGAKQGTKPHFLILNIGLSLCMGIQMGYILFHKQIGKNTY